jgi:hypothetical protein
VPRVRGPARREQDRDRRLCTCKGKRQIAELAESVLRRICKVNDGGPFSTSAGSGLGDPAVTYRHRPIGEPGGDKLPRQLRLARRDESAR